MNGNACTHQRRSSAPLPHRSLDDLAYGRISKRAIRQETSRLTPSLEDDALATIFSIILRQVAPLGQPYCHEGWEAIAVMDPSTAWNIAKVMSEEDGEDIPKVLVHAYRNGSFEEIRTARFLQREPPQVESSGSSDGGYMRCDGTIDRNTQRLTPFKHAFSRPYSSPAPGILLNTMDLYMPLVKFRYSKSMNIVQSSGMGKSRLVDHSATLRFAIPINLRDPRENGYPPADEPVWSGLLQNLKVMNKRRATFSAFMQALFMEVTKEISQYQPTSAVEIAKRWYDWLNEGASPTSVGENRRSLYARVIETMTELLVEAKESKALLVSPLSAAASVFLEQLSAICVDNDDLKHQCQARAFVYFDEAHTLFDDTEESNPYFYLVSALRDISDLPIFFVFLSTDSRLAQLHPKTASYIPRQITGGSKVIPPFIELLFDVFCRDFTSQAREAGNLTLNAITELKQTVKFGRPMWYTTWEAEENSVLPLAILKLAPTESFCTDICAKIAALDIRVLLQYDPRSQAARDLQFTMVKSYMRVIGEIPESRDHILTGYPSEPVLAEAAARLLNDSSMGDILTAAPKILNDALEEGLVAHKERGGMVARMLFTIAHDLAVKTMTPADPGHENWFHRPVPLLQLLSHLFGPNVLDVVMNARPHHPYPDAPPIKDAFKDAWLSFSHFVQLMNDESSSLACVVALLKRGAAAQPADWHKSMDLVCPLLFGDPAKTEIKQDNISFLQVIVTTASSAVKIVPDPRAIYDGEDSDSDVDDGDDDNVGMDEAETDQSDRPSNGHPILSIVMHLGVESTRRETPRLVKVQTIDRPASSAAGDDIHRRHYILTVYGCDSRTYGAIPESQDSLYKSIVGEENPYSNFPRFEVEGSRRVLSTLKLQIDCEDEDCMGWDT